VPVLLGFGTEILSFWSVGGGTLLLLMTLFVGVDQQTAQGINLLYFLPAAGLGLIYHRRSGHLDAEVIRIGAIWGTLEAVIGAIIAAIVSTDAIRRPFGLYLLFACGTFLFRKNNNST